MSQPFRLKSVLKIRCRERDQAGKDVADANAAISVLDSKLSEIELEERGMESLRRQFSSGAVMLSQILDAERYQLVLAAQREHILRDRSLLVQELERRQAKLVIKQQAVKVLEKLEQTHQQRVAEMQLRQEQFVLDEWSQVKTSIAIQGET
jgi:flagellar export protein FliJ